MKIYRIFITSFIISIVAFISFMAAYLYSILHMVQLFHENMPLNPDPFLLFRHIFSPALVISIAVLTVSGLLYRILGIVCIARHRHMDGGEQALWIIGFVLFGFITAIVFMALASGRNLIPADESHIDTAAAP